MKKAWRLFKEFWVGIWNVVRSMGNWKGMLSLAIVWLVLSGAGLILIGIIITAPILRTIGYAIYGFWVLPLTPLIPITIAIAMVVQRYVFQDKSVSWKNIKQQFGKAFEKKDKSK